MSNFHSHLSLVNNSLETAEFTIRSSHNQIQSIIVPPNESRYVKTDSIHASWDVYVTVNRLDSATLTTKNPNTTFTVTDESFSASEPFVFRFNNEALTARRELIEHIQTLRTSKGLNGLIRIAEHEIGCWQRQESLDSTVLEAVCSVLASVDLGNWDKQEALIQRCALAALSHRERLSVLEEVSFTLRLTEPAPSSDMSAQLTLSERTGYWLRAYTRLQDAIDPTFDPNDHPLLNVTPPVATGLSHGVALEEIEDLQHRAEYEKAIDENQRKAANYCEQHRLRQAEARLHGKLQRYLLTAYTRPRFYVEELENLLLTHESNSSRRAELLEPVKKMVMRIAPATTQTIPNWVARLTPRDNFPGRSTTQFGIGEEIELSFDVLSPLAAEQHGGLAWSIEDGEGTILTGGRDGHAIYRVGGTAGKVRLVAKVLSGPNKGAVAGNVELIGVAPTGASMTQQVGTGVWHVQNSYSVGFKGSITVSPSGVSYAGVTFREGAAVATATGWLAFKNGQVHAVGAACTITGTSVNGIDTVSSGQKSPPPAYAVGDFLWPIPWECSTDGGTTWSQIVIANHHETCSAAGVAAISKAGAGPFTKNAADASSNY
ncbi:MAG: hypothetical protein ACXV8O_03045 [Methylobacter sp.]